MGWPCIARFGLSFHDLKDQSTFTSLISLIWLICEGVTPIRSNTGEGGMPSSFGLTLPATDASCARSSRAGKIKTASSVVRFIRQRLEREDGSLEEGDTIPQRVNFLRQCDNVII